MSNTFRVKAVVSALLLLLIKWDGSGVGGEGGIKISLKGWRM
jgi:hypothetical protein